MADKQDVKTAVAVTLPAGKVTLRAELAIPTGARGLILVTQAGGPRFHPTNTWISGKFHQAGLATCLLDLLTPAEASAEDIRNDLSRNARFLAARLEAATDYWVHMSEVQNLKIGYLADGAAAAAAVSAAIHRPGRVCGIVSLNGRLDYAQEALSRLAAPTLVIAGENDAMLAQLNQALYEQIPAERRLKIIPRASLEDRAVWEEMGRLALDWFQKHLCVFQ